MVSYKPQNYIYDTFYLVDVLPPNVYRITRMITDIIDINKEFNKPLFQLVFNEPHNKRIVMTDEQINYISSGRNYDIYYSKCEYGYLYLVTEIIEIDRDVTYNKKILSEETFHQS
jgi:hypothetical protein